MSDSTSHDTAHRLPTHVRPTHYELSLAPRLSAGTFSGQVDIDVTVDGPTDRIVLHALDLEIETASVRLADGTELVELTTTSDPASETLSLQLGRTVDASSAAVHLEFRGTLNDQLTGFYRSTFVAPDPLTGDSVEHVLAVTQFESTHARRAFPCFDEPALKATFAISLTVDPDDFVVANTAEVERIELDDGRVTVRFADTIVMSTYLVAFVIGPLEATEPRMVAGLDGPIPLRVVHPPGASELCGFALDVAEAALRFFESYYELPYPGDKVDLVAVPDFAFGAMENLGCITFREVLLLVDPDRATQPELQRIADVVNHELAHMWFGDLVTMRWWNGIWLNEAFATFMEVMATDAFRPEWDVWTSFGLARAAAFDTDALHSTRPIEYEVVTAADAEGMFDILTYEKGASVVRMLEQYLGAEDFRLGISAYLRRHAFANTETTDLWDSLEEATGEPVRRIMDEWIFRGGHPLVHVDPVANGVRMSQERAGFDDDREAQNWPIPMVLTASTEGAGTSTRRLLLEEPATVELGGRPGFVQANVGGAGFYRVQLDASLRTALYDDGDPSPLERFVLLDDTWAAYLTALVAPGELATLLRRAVEDERDPSIWRRIGAMCRELARLAGRSHSPETAAFARDLSVPALQAVDSLLDGGGRINGLDRQEELRGVLLSIAGGVGEHAATVERARDLLDSDEADSSLRAAAIEVVAATATPEEHQQLERRWRQATTPQDELRFLNALVDTSDRGCFEHALDLACTEVRTQNGPYLLRRAITHRDLASVAWHAITSRWTELLDRFPANSLPRMLEGIRSVTDAELAGGIQEFVEDHRVPSGSRQVEQHLERMWVSVGAADRTRRALDERPSALTDPRG